MALTYDKPWADLTPEQKIDRLRQELQTFIDFYNGSVIQRNGELARIGDRLSSAEITLKSIAARLDAVDLAKRR
jgi:hypothetical protein